MPENQTPATKHEPSTEPGEFNFAKPVEENPRIKRRSLKTKPGGLIKPATGAPTASRELEREAPPLSAKQAQPAKARAQETAPAKSESTNGVKTASTTAAPPRTTPSPAPASTTSQPASTNATNAAPKTAPDPSAASTSTTTPSIRSTATPSTSPHGTRPATLYYSSQPRKDTEASATPMKTTTTASPASSSSASAVPTSVTRPATSSASRPATTVDYRANVERQSREQKSVGNILAYVVYALIAFFVISAGLAGYGAKVIFDRLHDQSATVSDLDARYAAANKDLNSKLATTQDTLTAAQAQIARQQELILQQQEALNKLIAATNDNANALKTERATRAQETATLRERVRELDNRTTTQKY